jgi:threonine dehydratase
MKPSLRLPITLQDIRDARLRISPYIRRTPLLQCNQITGKGNNNVAWKLENLQITGSFKLRGATNKMLSLSEIERKHGVITISSGNHGFAVGYAASQLGLRAVICMPETVPKNKVKAIEKLGAELVIKGSTYDEADMNAHNLQEIEDLTMVHPFDDPDIIAGQGTIGLELLEDYPKLDTVIIPVSGGGLLAGIALALKSTRSDISIIGVTMERGPSMFESLKVGRPVEVLEEPTLAHALAGGIGINNRYTFQIAQKLIDELVLVTEDEIASSMVYALREENLIVEGGGAVGLAVLLNSKTSKIGKNVVVMISGGNVDLALLCRLMRDY